MYKVMNTRNHSNIFDNKNSIVESIMARIKPVIENAINESSRTDNTLQINGLRRTLQTFDRNGRHSANGMWEYHQ